MKYCERARYKSLRKMRAAENRGVEMNMRSVMIERSRGNRLKKFVWVKSEQGQLVESKERDRFF